MLPASRSPALACASQRTLLRLGSGLGVSPRPARRAGTAERPVGHRCLASAAAAVGAACAVARPSPLLRRVLRHSPQLVHHHRRGARATARAMAASSVPDGVSRKVAVIGGGPAGVVACRFLRDAGHKPTVFEAGDEVGGIWAPDATNKVAYRGLVTNIPTIAMQSFDLDFPPGLPSYIKARDLGEYIASYAEHFGLRPLIQFGARVTSVEQSPHAGQDSADAGVSWRLSWSSGADQSSDTFDAVVVAKGHYDEPYAPEIPGQAEWMAGEPSPGARTIVHSREYDDPASYAGRAVLVVGGRSSAVDVARELRGTAKWVYVLEKGCTQVHVMDECTHVPLGAQLGADGLLRVGGEALPGPTVDSVILATGYIYAFPFLDDAVLGLEFGPAKRYVEPLWMHAIHARHPTLSFVGIPLAVPCPIPLFEAQSRFIAAHLRRELAGQEEMEAWVAARRKAVGERTQDWHFLSGNAWEHMRELTRMAGVEGAEFQSYEKRLDLVSQVYQDRVSRRPELPWGEDCYRRCEYAADWEAGTWEVTLPTDG